MAKQEFDNNKILSPEEQENFDKYMQEYESQNDLLVNAYNEDSKVGKLSKNKPVMIGISCLLFFGCLAGLTMSFNKVDKQNSLDVKPPVATQPVAQAPITTPEENAMTFEERQAEEESRKDLEQIKNNFNPFDGAENQNINNPAQPTEVNAVPQYPSSQDLQPAVNVDPYPHDIPTPPVTSYNHQPTPTPQQQIEMQQNGGEWMSLKGISIDRNGNRIAYIKNGTTTGTYGVGDRVSDYTVTDIDKTKVTVVNDNGNKMYLNK